MAAGDLTLFNQFKEDFTNGVHDFTADTIKTCFIDNTTAPTAAAASVAKTVFTEVSGGNFPATGTTMVTDVSEAAGTVTVDFTNNLSLASAGGNPTTVYYALVYNDTPTTPVADPCIGFVEIDLAGFDATGGALTLTWGANIFTLA